MICVKIVIKILKMYARLYKRLPVKYFVSNVLMQTSPFTGMRSRIAIISLLAIVFSKFSHKYVMLYFENAVHYLR